MEARNDGIEVGRTRLIEREVDLLRMVPEHKRQEPAEPFIA